MKNNLINIPIRTNRWIDRMILKLMKDYHDEDGVWIIDDVHPREKIDEKTFKEVLNRRVSD